MKLLEMRELALKVLQRPKLVLIWCCCCLGRNRNKGAHLVGLARHSSVSTHDTASARLLDYKTSPYSQLLLRLHTVGIAPLRTYLLESERHGDHLAMVSAKQPTPCVAVSVVPPYSGLGQLSGRILLPLHSIEHCHFLQQLHIFE